MLLAVLIPECVSSEGYRVENDCCIFLAYLNCVKIFHSTCVITRKNTRIKKVKTRGRTGDLTVGNIIFLGELAGEYIKK